MRRLPSLLGLLLLACAPGDGLRSSSEAIIEGVEAPELDGVVAVMERFGSADFDFFCSGAALTRRVVLTAKHCVVDNVDGPRAPDEVFVAVGLEVNTPRSRRDLVAVHRIFTTPGPYSLRGGDDIALLVLREEIVVEPFEVARQAPEPGETITLAGYGRRITGTPIPGDGGRRRRGTATVQSVVDNVIRSTGDSWICQGDSGGPAFDDAMRIVGVNSFGTDRACENRFGGYALVPGALELIQEALDYDAPCFPRDEECDGKDNDCDGVADPGCYFVGDPCEADLQCRSDRCEAVGEARLCTEACDPAERGGCGLGLRCEGDPCTEGRCVPFEPGRLGAGEACAADGDCAGGRCADGVCGVACQEGFEGCANGLVCSTADGVCGTCLPAASAPGLRVVGDPCDDAAQCGSGTCHEGICSRACDADASPCPLGTHCRSGLCVDGPRRGAGEACVNEDDCRFDAPYCVDDGERLCAAACDGFCSSGFRCLERADVEDVCVPEGVGLGQDCDADDACRSGLCETTCTLACEAEACPVGFACDADGLCRPDATGGCSVAGGPAASGPWFFAVLALVVLGRRRRRVSAGRR
jgi:MYXO-CTERM domain-containing protein